VVEPTDEVGRDTTTKTARRREKRHGEEQGDMTREEDVENRTPVLRGKVPQQRSLRMQTIIYIYIYIYIILFHIPIPKSREAQAKHSEETDVDREQFRRCFQFTDALDLDDVWHRGLYE